MTTIDRTDASDAEFQARIAPFDAAPVPPEGWEQRVEAAARAICEADYENVGAGYPWTEMDEGERSIYRRLAAAALTADAALAGQHTTEEEGR